MIILPTTRGVIGRRGFPALKGHTGSIAYDYAGAARTYGYEVTAGPAGGDPNMYLEQAIGPGQYKYWEFEITDINHVLPGITSNPAVQSAYGGGTGDARYYSNADSVTGLGLTGSFTAIAGDILGFTYNGDTRQLAIYKNNSAVFSGTVSGTGSIWPMFAWQGGAGKIRLRNGLIYAPPPGYSAY